MGTVEAGNLDNPTMDMHIGRIPGSELFWGEIDEVRFYRRALETAEIEALIEPGREMAEAPPPSTETSQLTLQLGNRRFTRSLQQPAFMAVRLPAGSLKLNVEYGNVAAVDRVVLTPLRDDDTLAQRFNIFEQRAPRIGVYVGLRRDCGSALTQVGEVQAVSSPALVDYVFEGAIDNFPSPDVEKDNVNYLAGVREIAVRSVYTDGRDMPRLLIDSIEFEGPLYEAWPPATHRNIFIDSDDHDDLPVYARSIIRSFASKAFRRPLTSSEEESLCTVWKDIYQQTNDFRHSIQESLVVVLTSPQFLFLIEKSDSPAAEPLNDYELASKLSYFLFNGPPDEPLLELAAAGKLRQNIGSQIDRMIEDPRLNHFLDEFVSQWLLLDKLAVLEVDAKQFPRLTRDVRTELRKEPIRYIQHLIRDNLSLTHLIESDFIVANEVLANYYDLGDRTENGFEFDTIRHDTDHLGGILSQAGILAGLSDGRESNPVKRGAWFARKIIAEPPDDPPPNVPALEEDTSHLPLRERLERHRNQPGCAKCHDGIDPWGLPFEHFDAAGRWNPNNGAESRSTLPDGKEIADLRELKTYLINERLDQVAFSFLKHLAIYATGRKLTYNEIEFLHEKGVELKPDGYRMRDMIHWVVQSDLFLQK